MSKTPEETEYRLQAIEFVVRTVARKAGVDVTNVELPNGISKQEVRYERVMSYIKRIMN